MFGKLPYMFGAIAAGVIAGGYYKWPEWDTSTMLPLTLVAGGISAVIFGATVTIAIHIKLSPPHKVNINVPKKITALQTLVSVSYIK